jgi:hypothetical protein
MFLASLVFDHEDGGDTFHRNIDGLLHGTRCENRKVNIAIIFVSLVQNLSIVCKHKLYAYFVNNVLHATSGSSRKSDRKRHMKLTSQCTAQQKALSGTWPSTEQPGAAWFWDQQQVQEEY